MEDATEKKARNFKVGDEVYSENYGEGVVTYIDDSPINRYPVKVQWKDETLGYDYYTLDGKFSVVDIVPEFNITLKGAKKVEEKDEKMDAKSEKFKVGDKVFSFHSGVGIVTRVDTEEPNNLYPIIVRWADDSKSQNNFDYFTKDGEYDTANLNDPERNIHPLEVIDLSDKAEDEEDDAINPKHYRVAGLPDAIDIMNHLMTKEQYEGFLWGNILKYAYRFGRKGDKAETAGKIAWYATKLQELGECESK